MDDWLKGMREEYNRDWERRELARYLLLLCGVVLPVVLVATRC